MVEVIIVVRKPGTTEPSTEFAFDLPEIPRVGDCISIAGLDVRQPAGVDIIARKIWWRLHHPENGGGGTEDIRGRVEEIFVECDIAQGPYSSEAHRRAVAAAEAKGITVETFGISRIPFFGGS